MSYKLSGISPLAYMGVEPSQPPQMLIEFRSPNPTDSKGYNLGTYWLVAAPPPTMNWELWILVDLTAGVATWVQLYPGSSGGVIRIDADVGFAIPALGIINLFAGANTNTIGDDAQTLRVNLNETIHWPATAGDGSAGAIYLNGSNGSGGLLFMHDYGTNNTWLGIEAGNLTLNFGTAVGETGIGEQALTSLTTGPGNTAIGAFSQASVTIGSLNTSLGAGSLALLVSGDENVVIGNDAGVSYTGAESNNIIISNPGVLGESTTTRIGVEATQTAAYMAGIFGRTVGASQQTVVVDNTGKLGSVISPPPVSQTALAFLGALQTNTGGGVGNLVPYLLGTTVPFTTIYDDTGGYYPGDGLGTPASFTATITGKYYLSVQILLYTSTVPRNPLFPAISIITPGRTYQTNLAVTSGDQSTGGGWIPPASPSGFQWPLEFSCIVDLNAGDVTTFSVFFGNSLASINPLILYGSNPNIQTFITGFLISNGNQAAGTITTVFNSSGTFFINPNTQTVEVYAWSGGGGGGSGSVGSGGVGGTAEGGSGAGAGNCFYNLTPAAFFNPAGEPVTIGAGGVGGASVVGSNTLGNDGTPGGATGIGKYLLPVIGYGTAPINGRGGTLSISALGGGPNIIQTAQAWTSLGQPGGNGNRGAGSFSQPNGPGVVVPVIGGGNVLTNGNYLSGTAGGGGSGYATAPILSGGHGGDIQSIDGSLTVVFGGLGGPADTAGSNGNLPPTTGGIITGGTGGGGGGAYLAVAAGAGGNGGFPGGGGGGGGGGLNATSPSGAGGNGAAGKMIIIEYL